MCAHIQLRVINIGAYIYTYHSFVRVLIEDAQFLYNLSTHDYITVFQAVCVFVCVCVYIICKYIQMQAHFNNIVKQCMCICIYVCVCLVSLLKPF